MDELSCRCAKFIVNALDSVSDVVSYVARHVVYYGRMLLEIWCFAIYSVLYDIAFITKDLVRTYVRRA